MTYIKSLLLFIFILGSFYTYSWYDTNAANTTPNWHYRVPIYIPANTAIDSTIKLDVDFNALMTQLGVSGSFDINSPRVVRANGALVTTQEFTDTIYHNVIDPTSNGKGEIKFIVEDAGAITYYLYFDTLENGAKAINPQATINGNFEHSSQGAIPSNWTISSEFAKGAQNNEVYDTSYGASYSGTVTCSDQAINNADASPNNAGNGASTTGRKWHLLGYRNKCEDGDNGKKEKIKLHKTIKVPATNAGVLSFYFQLQAYDSINYDFFQIEVNQVAIDHTQLGIANTDNHLTIQAAGIGRRNQYSSSLVDAGWQRATLNLSPYANQTITISFVTNFAADNVYRSWIKLDDIEWSIVTASLGTPEMQRPQLSMQKTTTTLSDPINGTTSPKAIPGAMIEYTITATNSGDSATDNNSIAIVDAIPDSTALYVADIAGVGSGPVNFTDGAIASGLTYNFTNLNSSSDNVSFSNDGGISFNYTPTPDAEGIDSNVSHIKITPSGAFSAKSGTNIPSFQLRFRVLVQ